MAQVSRLRTRRQTGQRDSVVRKLTSLGVDVRHDRVGAELQYRGNPGCDREQVLRSCLSMQLFEVLRAAGLCRAADTPAGRPPAP